MNNSEISNPDMPENLGASTPSVSANSNKWLKTGLLALVGLIAAVFLFSVGYWYGTQQTQQVDKTLTISQQPISTPTPKSTTTPKPKPTPVVEDETKDWRTFLSSRCNFSIKIPPEWNAKDIELVPGTDDPNYNYGCISILAPDYKIVGETREGLGLFIYRTIPGAKFKSVVINSVDDYIKAIENILEPPGQAKNVQSKAVGNISGKYFEFGAFENSSNFVFMKNNFIYSIGWLQGYSGIYKDRINPILSTFRFLE